MIRNAIQPQSASQKKFESAMKSYNSNLLNTITLMEYEFTMAAIVSIAAINGIGAGLFIINRKKTFIKNSIKTQARVRDIERVKDSRGNIALNIRVAFTNHNGTETTATIKNALLKTKTCNVGDVLEIFYLKNDSQQVITSHVAPLFQMFYFLCAGSGILALIAAYFVAIRLGII